MIDMSSLYSDDDYGIALNNFNSSSDNKRWKEFKQVELKVAKNKCPICECPLDNDSDKLTRPTNKPNKYMLLIPTIDHYRPQNIYPLLSYIPENYLLLCNDCNNVYKKNHFPLYPDRATHTTTATTMTSVIDEKPLLANPIYDNPLELFDLIFRRISNNQIILELSPKHTLSNNTYLYKKAKKTIELFGLKECQPRNTNENVAMCRRNLLVNLSGKFYHLALAINNMNENDFFNAIREFKNQNLNGALSYHGFNDILEKLQESPKYYGFYSFLFKKQFRIQ